MKIAIPVSGDEVFQHFGKSECFRFYDVADGKVLSKRELKPIGSGHSAIAGFLVGMGANAIICGGIGEGAASAMLNFGVAVLAGVEGNADEAIAAYLDGTLKYQSAVTCAHHSEGHSCGGSCSSCKGCK